jgi:hypothetical protein
MGTKPNGTEQWFSTFVGWRPCKFFFYKTRARYRAAAARRLRNTEMEGGKTYSRREGESEKLWVK